MNINRRSNQAGQVLLIAVMLLAVTLTVVLSITFSSRTDTQLTKLEEENQRALAAAEAGIEAALKSATGSAITIGEDGILQGSGFTGTATVADTPSTEKNKFSTPIIQKDEQFTFYMGTYHSSTNTIDASLAQDVLICFGSTNQSTKTALEITLVKGSTPTLKRFVIDPPDASRITGAENGTEGCSANSAFQYSTTIDDTDIGTDTKLILVRTLFNSSKVLFSRTADLPSQGKFVSSEATSQTGVSKKVELFQSHPQIPSDFFVTGF